MVLSNSDNIERITGKLNQPPGFASVLRALDVARRQGSLYGIDHPSTPRVIDDTVAVIKDYLSRVGSATCIFAKDAVIVNEHYYQSSADSKEMFHRLRARGVLAFTFVSEPTVEELKQFTVFLNAEPREVKREDGPVSYLRHRGVIRITVTEAVYTDDDVESESSKSSQTAEDSGSVDHVVAAAIRWLSKEDGEVDESLRRPLREILSDPDMAARLIREAVTKLHVSRRTENTNDLANEVVLNLKTLSGEDTEGWDQVAPQVRKAISKLPRNLRPVSDGLTVVRDGSENDTIDVQAWKAVDTQEVEMMVAEVIESKASGESKDPTPKLDAIIDLLGAKASGLPSSWAVELQTSNVMRSSGGTLSALLSFETAPTEHIRIARALASLIPHALEINDLLSALTFAEDLAREARSYGKLDWRSINARSALQSVELPVLRNLLYQALQSGKYEARMIASSLVEILPELAVNVIDLLGRYPQEAFNESLEQGIKSAGQAALTPLGKVLRTGSPSAKLSALEVLAKIGSASAVMEISAVLDILDSGLVAKVPRLLAAARIPLTEKVCLRLLNHKAVEVRCSALWALGELGEEGVLPVIKKIAAQRGLFTMDNVEKIAAIDALRKIGGQEALECLTNMANHRPLFGRDRYEPVRQAAQTALDEIRIEELIPMRLAV